MTADDITALFTRADGTYLFARWGRPLVPVVFGVDDATLATVKGALQAVAHVANLPLAETDPELGANLMVFFATDWNDIGQIPDLDRLIPGLDSLLARLQAADANQYRIFRFDPAGAIRAAFVFLRMDPHLSAVPADVLALSQAVQTILLWSDSAFHDRSALVETDAGIILRPEIGQLIRAAYDPILPPVATDPAHALRLAARVAKLTLL